MQLQWWKYATIKLLKIYCLLYLNFLDCWLITVTFNNFLDMKDDSSIFINIEWFLISSRFSLSNKNHPYLKWQITYMMEAWRRLLDLEHRQISFILVIMPMIKSVSISEWLFSDNVLYLGATIMVVLISLGLPCKMLVEEYSSFALSYDLLLEKTPQGTYYLIQFNICRFNAQISVFCKCFYLFLFFKYKLLGNFLLSSDSIISELE